MNEQAIVETAPFSKPPPKLGGLPFLWRMIFRMTFQIFLMWETLLALKTLKCFFPSVNAHVNLEVSFKTETFAALRTDERLLSSVSFYVGLQVSFECATLSTEMARERLLSGVDD